MTQYQVFAIIISLAALFSYLNLRIIKLSPTIGMTALSLLFSLALLAGSVALPQFTAPLLKVITSIDFRHLLLDNMLGFLLFAGSMHIDAQGLKQESWPVITLATIGIFISTFLIGTAMYYLLGLFHLDIAYIYCLLFAALISPTDPIAVLAILKTAGLPKSLELKIAGESLFNDGVAVVVFLTLLQAAEAGVDHISVQYISTLFLQEAVGGLLFGLALGYLGYLANRSINKYEVEVLVTIATVTGGYMVANLLHISGPLAMVVAGIIIGNKAKGPNISDVTRDYLFKFWELIDEILNALLFMLLGFEMLTIKFSATLLIISVAAIVLVLFARWISVSIPALLLRKKVALTKTDITVLTWGGLRGGLSIALALSLPAAMHRDVFVFITFAIVLFSIFAQGLTIRRLYLRLEKHSR